MGKYAKLPAEQEEELELSERECELPFDLQPIISLNFPQRHPKPEELDHPTTVQIEPSVMIAALNEAAHKVGYFLVKDPDASWKQRVVFKETHVSNDAKYRRCIHYDAGRDTERMAVKRCIRAVAAKFGLPCKGKDFGIKVEHYEDPNEPESCGIDWTFQSFE